MIVNLRERHSPVLRNCQGIDASPIARQLMKTEIWRRSEMIEHNGCVDEGYHVGQTSRLQDARIALRD